MNTLAQHAMHNRVVATIYERAWRPVLAWTFMGFDLDHLRHERRLTAEGLRLADGDLVLDLACGPGNFTRYFAEAVAPSGLAVGVDLSEPMLARARRDNAHPRAAYVQGNGHHLPFPDGVFDAVNCYAALYLIPDPFRAYDELVRVLRPGGRISIMTSLASPRSWVRPLQVRALAPTGLRMFGRTEFTARLREAGFTDIEQEIHGSAQYVRATKAG